MRRGWRLRTVTRPNRLDDPYTTFFAVLKQALEEDRHKMGVLCFVWEGRYLGPLDSRQVADDRKVPVVA